MTPLAGNGEPALRTTVLGGECLEPRDPVKRVPIASLRDSDSPRSDGVDLDHVQLLSEVQVPLPPIVVHRSTMRVIDGMHRLKAAILRGRDHIEVRYFDGDDEDAFVLAVQLNAAHGLPLSAADRTAAAARVLGAHPEWSDQAIAALAGISDKTVAAIRRASTAEHPAVNYRIGRDGRRRPLNPTEGRMRASALFTEKADAPLREVAAEAGISLNTARDVRERLRRGEDPVPEQRRGRTCRDTTADRHDSADTPPDLNDALALAPDWKAKFDVLARDPALRFNEEGRTILRLLHSQMMGAQAWERLIENVPTHSTASVAEAARRCGQAWQQFARRLEARQCETGTTQRFVSEAHCSESDSLGHSAGDLRIVSARRA
ncbi:ParB/RepB/Spo0J family partition protein [Nocardia iowensis]|uniref:ParB/RepB/Spo0J family partition protein n=2 Tax=Nocardia iowensis TaxID=204891 RepID=UPI0031F0B210